LKLDFLNSLGQLKYKNCLKVALVVIVGALLTEVRFHPFEIDFRVAVGVVFFIMALMYDKELPILLTSTSMTATVLLIRIAKDILVLETAGLDATIMDSFLAHFPGAIYYTIFGFLIFIFGVRELDDQPLFQGLLLGLMDFGSNFTEVTIRYFVVPETIGDAAIPLLFLGLLILGLIRMSFVSAFITTLRHTRLKTQREMEQKRLNELLFLTSDLQKETFFLQKSVDNVEYLTTESYNLYQKLLSKNELDLSKTALNVSTKIHEIKKDYENIYHGLKGLVETDITSEFSFEKILELTSEKNKQYAFNNNKKVKIKNYVLDNFYPKDPLIITSILNNLITNAVEAIEKYGLISIQESYDDYKNEIVIAVKDNGIGINEKDLPFIFTPGYTKKCEEETGWFNSGMGLYHIKELVEEKLNGSVEVESKYKEGSTFKVKIPAERIVSAWDNQELIN